MLELLQLLQTSPIGSVTASDVTTTGTLSIEYDYTPAVVPEPTIEGVLGMARMTGTFEPSLRSM